MELAGGGGGFVILLLMIQYAPFPTVYAPNIKYIFVMKHSETNNSIKHMFNLQYDVIVNNATTILLCAKLRALVEKGDIFKR